MSMEYIELVKNYSKQVNDINALSEDQYNNIIKCLEVDKIPVFIKPLENSDFIPGTKIYVGEYDRKIGINKLTWHIYKITYVRGDVVFYIRDNGKKEYYFDINCNARDWMFPIKIDIGENSLDRVKFECKCPLIKIKK